MITSRKINIPIFNFKLHIIVTDTWEEAKRKFPVISEVDTERCDAFTMYNESLGTSIVAICVNTVSNLNIVHESIHVKNNIWEYIGYSPQAGNDEVDAYLATYICNRILEVYNKHK